MGESAGIGPVEQNLELALTPRRIVLLCAYGASVILLIPADLWIAGSLAFLLCASLVATDPEPKLRLRLGVLLLCVAILAICDINPGLSNRNFLQVGIPFGLVILLPGLCAHYFDKGVLSYRLWPQHWERRELLYILISIPLAWLVLQVYGWGNRAIFQDELFRHWHLSADPDKNEIRRLFLGINAVGIWDELFFVSTSFALLRSLFRYHVANAVQAILYTAVLYDMAFTGCGIVIVYLFAWTQGSMFERSRALVGVLIVHLIVDFFLVASIVNHYYPDYGSDFLWRHGL